MVYMYTYGSDIIYRISLPVILSHHLTTPSGTTWLVQVRRLDMYIHSLSLFVMHILHVSIKPKGATSERPVIAVTEGVYKFKQTFYLWLN